eukprot:4686223-Karenia_brevis.AAC.1
MTTSRTPSYFQATTCLRNARGLHTTLAGHCKQPTGRGYPQTRNLHAIEDCNANVLCSGLVRIDGEENIVP